MKKKIISLFLSVSLFISFVPAIINVGAEEVNIETEECKQEESKGNKEEVIEECDYDKVPSYSKNDIQSINNSNELFISQNGIHDEGYVAKTKGSVNNLAIFVTFQGQTLDSAYKSYVDGGRDYNHGTVDQIVDAFNNNENSLEDYIYSISNGKLDVTTEFYPKDKNGNITSIEVPHSYGYYLRKTDNNPDGYTDNTDAFRRRQFFHEYILKELETKIDYTRYDCNKDNIIDNVTFIVPNIDNGNSNDDGLILRPDFIRYWIPFDNYNGIQFMNCTIMPAPYMSSLGSKEDMYRALAHEYLHFLGGRELIDNDSSKDYVGNWSMSSSSNGYPLIEERYSYGEDWIKDDMIKTLPTIENSKSYVLNRSSLGSNDEVLAYKIAIPGCDEYYMMEYRNKDADIYEKQINSSGLLVYKVNPNVRGNTNSNGLHEIEVVRPNNDGSTENAALREGQSYKLSLTGTDGTYDFTISNMKEEKDTVTIMYSASKGTTSNELKLNSLADEKICANTYSLLAGYKDNDRIIDVDDTVKFKALASGGSNTLTYEFKVDGFVEQEYSTNNEFIWKPKYYGNYKILVTVKDSNGNTKCQQMDYAVSLPLETPEIILDRSKGMKVGEELRIYSTNYVHGYARCKYRIWIRNNDKDTDRDEVILDWTGKERDAKWTPKQDGNYTIYYDVCDGCGRRRQSKQSYKVRLTDITSADFTCDKSSTVNIGDKLSFNVTNVKGGMAPYKYSFYYDYNKNLSLLSDSTTNNIKYIPQKTGKYVFFVDIEDSTGCRIRKYLDEINVIDPTLRFTSVRTDLKSPQLMGSSIKIGASAVGGSGIIRYRFSVYLNGVLKSQSSVSKEKIYTWKPSIAGNYVIKVEAKDETGKVISATNKFIIYNKLKFTGYKTSIQSPQLVGSTVNIGAVASGNGAILYRFCIYRNGVLLEKSIVSKENQYKWIPKYSGDYVINVEAKDSTNKIIKISRNYSIKDKLVISKISTDKISPQGINTNIKLSVSASGGIGTKSCMFYYKLGNTKKIIKDFDAINYTTWKPTIAGKYVIYACVKDSKGNTTTKAINYIIV